LKAQIFSSDFIIGLTVFLTAMIIFEIFYASLQSDISDYAIRNDIQSKANNIANLLVTSSGNPQYWNSTNVKVLGLYDSGLINLTKFEELKNINYYAAKSLLGAGGYELYISLKNETGQVLRNDSITYDFGMESNENTLQAFYVERYGLTDLNGNITKTLIGVVVWS